LYDPVAPAGNEGIRMVLEQAVDYALKATSE